MCYQSTTSINYYENNYWPILVIFSSISNVFLYFAIIYQGYIPKRESQRPNLIDNILKDKVYKECFRLYLQDSNQDSLYNYN